MKVHGRNFVAVWMEKRGVRMIDQRLLPHSFKVITLKNHRQSAEAIRNMTVRGAGSIGAAAGYAAAQAVMENREKNFKAAWRKGFELIRKTRPTARDLFYAVEKIEAAVRGCRDPDEAAEIAQETAEAISHGYIEAGKRVGEFGNRLIKSGDRILTHCNAGWLGLQDWGSALAPIYAAHRAGKKIFVYVDETRPRLQGMKLTAWELQQEGVPFAIIPDNAAGHFMRLGKIDLAIVGADRIAMNGDAANKIGTYEKAVLAKENGVPFYVAAPLSTIDRKCARGDLIPIEERGEEEVLLAEGLTRAGRWETVRLAPAGVKALNPAFDVTPAKYITRIITDKGIVAPGKIGKLFNLKMGASHD
jgi:methylthioribose-1-phosphate isomerase